MLDSVLFELVVFSTTAVTEDVSDDGVAEIWLLVVGKLAVSETLDNGLESINAESFDLEFELKKGAIVAPFFVFSLTAKLALEKFC